MAAESKTTLTEGRKVFLSYSRSDQTRVTGLGLLLEALGHQVFLDHKTILPGTRWQAELQEGLNEAEVLLVYWTKHASQSDWVRKEIEYSHAHFPERLLVPVLGDETPLSELLNKYQHSDFCPLINDLLALKRSMEQQGAKPKQIQEAILNRLAEAGIEVDKQNQKKLFRLFLPTSIIALMTMPAAFLAQIASTGVEAVAELSKAQIAIVIAAAASGAVVCGLNDWKGEPEPPQNTGALNEWKGGSPLPKTTIVEPTKGTRTEPFRISGIKYPKTIITNSRRKDLVVTYAGAPEFPIETIGRPRSCPNGHICETHTTKFDTPPDDRRLVHKNWIYCFGLSQEMWVLDYEIVVRDSAGHEVSEPVRIECHPQ